MLAFSAWGASPLRLGVEDEGNNESGRSRISLWISKTCNEATMQEHMCDLPVKAQDLAENQDQDHADKDSRLLHVGPNALVTDDTDTVSCSHACDADR